MTEWVSKRTVLRFGRGREQAVDHLIAEEPIEVRLEGTPIAVLMRTPGSDHELVLGFAITEGIVTGPSEVGDVVPLGEGRWDVRLIDSIEIDPSRFQRNLYATSSCGVCGKASIDAIKVAGARPNPGPMVDAETMLRLPDQLIEKQPAFAQTGGVHAAGVFDAAGEFRVIREDVGRHNAVDKVVGSLAPDSWPLEGLGLFVSGRISFEIVQKAAVAGIGLVAGVSAASSLAVDLADDLGMTVAGFVRGTGFTVYSGPGRIVGA